MPRRKRYTRGKMQYDGTYSRGYKLGNKPTNRFSHKREYGGRTTFLTPYVLPNRYYCKLRYVTYGHHDHANAVNTSLATVYRANSLYDPEVGLGGHQPLGFDQLCLFYNHFIVVGSKISMTPIGKSAANAIPVCYGISLTDQGTRMNALAPDYILEQEGTTKTIRQMGSNINTMNSKQMTAKKFFSAKKFFQKKQVYDSQFQCSSAADCTEGAYFECWTVPAQTNTGDPPDYEFMIQIDYIVCCIEPKPLAQS